MQNNLQNNPVVIMMRGHYIRMFPQAQVSELSSHLVA